MMDCFKFEPVYPLLIAKFTLFEGLKKNLISDLKFEIPKQRKVVKRIRCVYSYSIIRSRWFWDMLLNR